ncbi:MAG: hypothetical protein ABW176_02270 [Candidatus Thiodiazotropha endolucinida]
MPRSLADHGDYVWSLAFKQLNLHWLHVASRNRHEEDGYRELRNLFLAHVEDLQAVQASPVWEITEVGLITPSHISESEHWSMEQLKQILLGIESDIEHEQHGYMFVLTDDTRFVVSCRNQEDDLVDVVSVYDCRF